MTTIKITLALAGILLFLSSIKFEVPALRWAGLGCVLVAWVLRFRKPPAAGPPDPTA